MKLPHSLAWLRATRPWQRAQDWRILRRQRALRKFLEPLIPKGGRVFDIGANVGHKSLLYLDMGARVVAVEPQSALVARLRRRFGSHPRLSVLHTALGNSAGQLTLHKCSGESAIASLRDDYASRSRFSATHQFDSTRQCRCAHWTTCVPSSAPPIFAKLTWKDTNVPCSTAFPVLWE